MNIALIYGGMSSEHEVSCRSARTIAEAIDTQKHTVYQIFITKTGQWKAVEEVRDYDAEELDAAQKAIIIPSREKENLWICNENTIKKVHIDVALPVLHGMMGEDGTIQGVFEIAGIPYVGCGVLASAAAMDKLTTKLVVEPLGIRQAQYVGVYRYELDAMDAVMDKVEKTLPYPVFVKPSNAGSSVGVSQAHNREELGKALLLAAEHDSKILVEETIVGHEVECAVLGNLDVEATQVGEILAADTFYTYEAKYSNPDSQTVIASYLPKETIEEIRMNAIRIFKALDGRGLSRVDFFIEKDTGCVVFNEINTFPGFTSISMYPMLWKDSGIDTPELVERLLQLALTR